MNNIFKKNFLSGIVLAGLLLCPSTHISAITEKQKKIAKVAGAGAVLLFVYGCGKRSAQRSGLQKTVGDLDQKIDALFGYTTGRGQSTLSEQFQEVYRGIQTASQTTVGRFHTLDGAVNTVTCNIGDVQNDVDTLTTSVDTLTTSVGTLQTAKSAQKHHCDMMIALSDMMIALNQCQRFGGIMPVLGMTIPVTNNHFVAVNPANIYKYASTFAQSNGGRKAVMLASATFASDKGALDQQGRGYKLLKDFVVGVSDESYAQYHAYALGALGSSDVMDQQNSDGGVFMRAYGKGEDVDQFMSYEHDGVTYVPWFSPVSVVHSKFKGGDRKDPSNVTTKQDLDRLSDGLTAVFKLIVASDDRPVDFYLQCPDARGHTVWNTACAVQRAMTQSGIGDIRCINMITAQSPGDAQKLAHQYMAAVHMAAMRQDEGASVINTSLSRSAVRA